MSSCKQTKEKRKELRSRGNQKASTQREHKKKWTHKKKAHGLYLNRRTKENNEDDSIIFEPQTHFIIFS